VIYSPFITENRIGELHTALLSCADRGVQVFVVTKTQGERSKGERATYSDLLMTLESWGVVVIPKKNMHEKLVFVDDDVIWSGSLNPLSYSYTQEIMERRQSKPVSSDFQKTLRMGELVAEYHDGPPHCPICGNELRPAGSGLSNSLNAPIVGMVPSADGGGYFMVASDGGVFAFGDARLAGSCPGIGGCSGAAVAVMPDASGNGYWLVTKAGAVYTFGDAPNYGAPAPQDVPVTSAVRTPDGRGYWILFANGVVTNFGDAGNFGSPAGQVGGLDPATAIFTTSDGGGYWVAAANGAVANYGDAPSDGSMLGTRLNGPIIAATGW